MSPPTITATMPVNAPIFRLAIYLDLSV
jgi:hypothetical protein